MRERARKLALDVLGSAFPRQADRLTPLVMEALAAERKLALEEAAEYVATHYPVHVTGNGVSRWELEETRDGGKIQSTYAAALRALLSKEGAERE
jgi:hypothetical protein